MQAETHLLRPATSLPQQPEIVAARLPPGGDTRTPAATIERLFTGTGWTGT